MSVRSIAACACIGSALGLLSGLKTRAVSAAFGMPLEPNWLVFGFAAWGLAALPIPALIAGAHRVRPDRAGWWSSITVHAGIWFVFWIVFTACFAALRVGLAETTVPLATVWVRDAFWALNWTFFIYSAMVGVAWSAAYQRETQVAKLREAQMRTRLARGQARSLRAQLEPHFLFNALHGVGALVHDHPAAARQMLLSLAELLKRTLTSEAAECATLRDELDLVRHYVELQQMRVRDGLTIQWHVDGGLDQALVPRLVLLTLVENAITHAFAAGRQPLTLDIAARRDGTRLVLEVGDDGPGLGGSLRRGTGIGLANTRKRLEAMYGVAATLEMIPRSRGLLVRITLPRRTDEAR